jgi:SAM-dependent methyltransferase
MTAPLSRDELDAIAERTLEHYGQRAESFWEGTRDHDVTQNIDALLQAIVAAPPFTILDFGCGPGRDLAAFTHLGHRAIGLEGVREFASMARDYSGCEVWEQDFLKLDLPAARFDGIFANAALFHVPRQELTRVLRELHATLKSGGVLFSSNPRGNDEEGWSGGRFGAWHSLEGWRRFIEAAGFIEVAHYYRPAGLPREQQPWLATVCRKLG